MKIIIVLVASIILTSVAPGQSMGDANSDGAVNVGDAVFIINYVFREGAAPEVIDTTIADRLIVLEKKIDHLVYILNILIIWSPDAWWPRPDTVYWDFWQDNIWKP